MPSTPSPSTNPDSSAGTRVAGPPPVDPVHEGTPLLSVRDLRVTFPTDDGLVKAVDGVSYDLYPNEVLGIVGESGSGKSVTSLAIMGLLPKTATIGGEIIFRGQDLLQ